MANISTSTTGFPSEVDTYTTLTRATQATKEQYNGMNSAIVALEKHTFGVFNVKTYGAVGDGTTDDRTYIQSAIDAAEAAGGGIVFFPPGTYLLSNGNSGASSWNNRYCLSILSDNVHLVGSGTGATILKLAASANAHVIQIGQRTNGTVTVSDCSVRDLEIDGNRSSQSTPDDTNDHNNGIDVSTGCSRIKLERLYIHDCMYYGIGFQSGQFTDCSIRDVTIANTGADGFDGKDESNNSTGNVMDGVQVSAFGLLSGLTNQQAGIDFRGGWHVSNCTVDGFGTAKGLHGIRVNVTTAFTTAEQPVSFVNCFANGGGQANTVGFYSNALQVRAANIYVSNVETGYSIRERDYMLSNLTAETVTTGFSFVGANRAQLTSCVVRNASGTAYSLTSSSGGNMFSGCIGFTVGTGISLAAGCNSNRFIGGAISTASVTALSDSGTGNVFQFVGGIVRANSGTGSIASGATTATVNHGLQTTPSAANISVVFTEQGTNNYGRWWISNITPTQFTVNVSSDPGASNLDFSWQVVIV